MITINKDILEKIFQEAVEGYPEEVCGLCAGEKIDTADSIYTCKNIQNKLHAEDPKKYPRTAVNAYNIDPEDWMEIMCKTQSEEKTLNVIYHSHIDCEAYFSEEDQRMAAPIDGEPSYPDLVYLVISVVDKKISGTATFAWNQTEKKFSACKSRRVKNKD